MVEYDIDRYGIEGGKESLAYILPSEGRRCKIIKKVRLKKWRKHIIGKHMAGSGKVGIESAPRPVTQTWKERQWRKRHLFRGVSTELAVSSAGLGGLSLIITEELVCSEIQGSG